ncbi:hypothetical protein BAJUN_02290 [Bajunvirus bajun]|uniref:Uncharacterized protein n=1 Tax=Brevundimonas phage vB_BgoS-Bajun TaxID=2948594 RepID=A0A9E7N4Z7_9CAUD|nr:hypothetical protein BAJUN_02290 [Brevundimonas phage vB_BgoS-Bajun]
MPNLSYKSHDDLIAAWGPDLTIGLLYGPPNPDGTDVIEPDAGSGYARLPITFTKVQADGVTYLTNDANIIFGPADTTDWQPVDTFGIFDAAGDLRVYGRLRTTRTVTINLGAAFPIDDIQLRLR